MKQQSQVKLLIISCLIILAGLISIQYYLIRNTYQLTSETYVNDVKKQIAPVVESPEMDSIEELFFDRVKKLCLKKSIDSLSVGQFQKEVRWVGDSMRYLSRNYLQSQFEDYPILREIRFRSRVTQIVFETDSVYDTLLKFTEIPIDYLGQDFKGKAFNINTGNVHSSVDTENDSINQKVKYFYKHNQSADMDISNFQFKILKKMTGMLIAAVALILSVIILFFWMYRSLIKQKKIAEVKTDFANNISHELKTPVSSLSLIIKSLKIEEINQNPQKLNELIISLERQNKRIQNLTERVLESSMEYKTELQKADIIQFLKGILSDFKSEKHNINLEIEPETLTIRADYYLLERVVQNLLENAQKYSPGSSEIKVKSYVSNSEFIIEIQDKGIGISTTEQQKIFDKFYRVSEGNRHNIKGLGLGLYLSMKMMKSMGGNISVKSKLGEGSTFILKIPAV